jgi:hypothetical protein
LLAVYVFSPLDVIPEGMFDECFDDYHLHW